MPGEWRVSRLADLTGRRMGSINPQDFPEELFEYYSIPAYQESGDPVVVKGATVLSQKQLVKDGAVLFGKLNPRVEKVWLVESRTDHRKIASTEWLPIYPDPSVADSRFLYFMMWTSHVMPKAQGFVAGSTPSRERVDPSSFYEIEIPLPPLPEQRKIAAVLGKVQEAIAAEAALVRNARDLKQSLLHHLFTHGLRNEPLKQTEIGRIPESWEVVPVGNIAQVGNGSTPKRTNAAYWQDGQTPWLTSAKVYDGVIEKADEFVTDAAVRECHLPQVKAGSLLIAITGQGKTLGNVAITAVETTISQHLAFVQFERTDVEPNFIRFFLEGRYEHLRQIALGGGSTKGALTCGFLKSYGVPVPSQGEQREIASMLQTADEKIAVHEARYRELQDLFRTLLHQFMTGRVRVDGVESAMETTS